MNHRRALCCGILDQLDHPVEVVVVHHLGALSVVQLRVVVRAVHVHKSRLQGVQKRPGNAFFDQGVIRGDAHLTVVEAFAPGHSLAGVHEMGCGIHYGWTLATQFQGERGQILGRRAHHLFSNGRPPREANVLEGEGGEMRTHLRSALHHCGDHFWHGMSDHIRKHLGRFWRVLRWLDDDTVPSRQCADKRPQGENEWEIPR